MMKRTTLALLCGLAAVSPALAEKSDRAFVEQMRDQIMTARSEPGVARAGAAELAAAERRLPELAKAMDDNEAQDARAARDGINALIQAARVRARTAQLAQVETPARPAAYAPPVVSKPKAVKRVAYRPSKARSGCTLASR
jgi:hypothetical protein